MNLLASVTKLGNLAVLLFGCLVVTTSCSPSIPEHVWIPGPQYRVELEVRLDDGSSGSAAVGEWIGLRVERTSGPWVQVSSRGDDGRGDRPHRRGAQGPARPFAV